MSSAKKRSTRARPYAAQTSGQGSGGFGFGLEEFGELFDGFGLFDDMHGENVRGRGFLKFVAQFGSELVEAVDAFAEFSFVLLEAATLGGGSLRGSGMHFGRVGRVCGRGLRRRR